MNRLRMISVAWLVLLVTKAGVLAQPMADRLPPQTLMYAGWSPGAALIGTVSARMLADERFVRPWKLLLDQVLTMPQAMGAAEGAADSTLAEQLPLLLGDAIQCPVAFALTDMKQAGREWQPQAVLMIKLGAHRASFEEHFKPIHSRLKSELGDRIHMMKVGKSWIWMKTTKDITEYSWGFLDDRFIFYFGDGGEAFLPTLVGDKPERSLATAGNFSNAIGKVPGDAYLTSYIDLRRVGSLLQAVLKDSTNSDIAAAAMYGRKTAAALGLDNATALAQKMWVENGEYVFRSLMATDGPPHGLLSDLVQPAVDDATLKLIPADAMAAVAMRLDMAKFYASVKTAAVAIAGADAGKSIEVFEDEAADRGIPVAKLLAPLGDQWVFYNAGSTGGFPLLGMTAVVNIRDPEKIHQAMAGVERFAARLTYSGGVRVASYEADGVNIRYLQGASGNFISPAYAIVGDHLAIALYPQLVEDAVKQIKGDGPSLLDRPGFSANRQRIAQLGPMMCLSQPEFVKAVYPLLLPLVSLINLEFHGIRNGDAAVPQEDLIPSLRRLLRYCGDETVSIRVTPDGLVSTRSVVNPLLSPLSFFDAAPLWIALAIPTLGKAQLSADRSTSAANMRQIGQTLTAGDPGHKFPRDLETALREHGQGMELLKSPFGPAKGGRDYIYIYDETLTTNSPADAVILYDAAELEQGDGTTVLYVDGHTDWLTREQANQAIMRAPVQLRGEKK